MSKTKKVLPPCYGEDDCSSTMMSRCTFVNSCGKNLPEDEAIYEALIYWRNKSDEYLREINKMKGTK